VSSSRTVIVAGAGIAGLTAALALSRGGFRVVVLEQAPRLEETGAGIQLSPNAARILIDLGLGDRLRPYAVAPEAVRVMDAASGREIVRIPLGDHAARRYGAPYWIIHRGDLQAALAGAVAQKLDVTLKLGMRAENFAAHGNGVTVAASGTSGIWHEQGMAMVAADGVWSNLRSQLSSENGPRFAGRVAWRAVVPVHAVAAEFRAPLVHLWLGRHSHLVHYPVKGGRVINLVFIAADRWSGHDGRDRGWSEPASRTDFLSQLAAAQWTPQALSLLRVPEAWLKWALFGREPLFALPHAPFALIGDAAHAMLPFLAQGAAMAIEDAAVLAQCLSGRPDDIAGAVHSYARLRRARVRKVQRLAARNGRIYHFAGLPAVLRNGGMRIAGGERLLHRYDWLYDWRSPESMIT